jgi:signal transduction histidine kinase
VSNNAAAQGIRSAREDAASVDVEPASGGATDSAQALATGVEAAGVSESVGLAVYRIVQEAVTNVVKHAAPAKCRVRVVVGSDEIRVEVTDDGSRATRGGEVGHGLTGMRERVAMHGGTFSAEPREGGGFAVTATLPVGERR